MQYYMGGGIPTPYCGQFKFAGGKDPELSWNLIVLAPPNQQPESLLSNYPLDREAYGRSGKDGDYRPIKTGYKSAC